jgi:hypothetical protein
MHSGFRIIFWGIFFVTIHINLGPIAILPAFVGYMIVSRGIEHLQEGFDTPYFRKARIASMLLTMLGVISFLLIWAPQQSIIMSYYPLLFSVLEFFLVYYILEGSIEKFELVDSKELASDYRSEQRTYLVFMTIYIIGMCIAITIGEATFAFIMIIIGLFLRLWLLMMMGRLKRTQQEPEGATNNHNSMDQDGMDDDGMDDDNIDDDNIDDDREDRKDPSDE